MPAQAQLPLQRQDPDVGASGLQLLEEEGSQVSMCKAPMGQDPTLAAHEDHVW